MSGAGNDFIIFDSRNQKINLSKAKITELSDRKNIGCDQLIILRDDAKADCFMEIFNSDGSISGACGNATRCVASILMNLTPSPSGIVSENKNKVIIRTTADILECWAPNSDEISVNMGIPGLKWQEIPLLEENNSENVSLHGYNFFCVNMGNPHAVTFIKEPLSDETFFEIGPRVETDPLFPEKTNVEFARIISEDLIEVRVWERGAGETLACGTGACAVGVSAIKQSLVSSDKVITKFKGGNLVIHWPYLSEGKKAKVTMTGGYKVIGEGAI